jgi:hypothetical protein
LKVKVSGVRQQRQQQTNQHIYKEEEMKEMNQG